MRHVEFTNLRLDVTMKTNIESFCYKGKNKKRREEKIIAQDTSRV